MVANSKLVLVRVQRVECTPHVGGVFMVQRIKIPRDRQELVINYELQ